MKQPAPVHPTPKADFLQDGKAVKAHRALIDDPSFKRSIETAQAHYTRLMCNLAPTDLNSPNQLQASAMCFQRIQGMNDFVATLMNLAEVPRVASKTDTDNLQHQ